MHLSTLTGACLFVLSALVNDASAYVNPNPVTPTSTPAAVPYGGGSPSSVKPVRFSTSVYSTQKGSIRTIQTCTTEFAGFNPPSVPTSVATIRKSSTTKVTKTETGVRYVTNNNQAKTVTKTTTKVCTSTAKAITRTAYSTRTVKVTSVRTLSTLKTITTSLPAHGAPASNVVVPAPSGFIYAAEDPANDESNFPALEERYVKKRYAVDQSKAAAVDYPKAVKCTKTLQTIYTSTQTINSRSTSTVYGRTVTSTFTKRATKTVIPVARTITSTRVTTSTIVSTLTRTSYTTVTKKSTPSAPATTSYAACNSNNIFKGPTGSVGALTGSDSVEVPNVSTPEECCAKCQAHVNKSGAKDCAGSFFATTDGKSTCSLRLTDVCTRSSNVGMFVPHPDDEEVEGSVSNGPCGRWVVLTDLSYVPTDSGYN